MMSLVPQHGKQCMPCSVSFSMALQTSILSTENSNFLKERIILKSFNYVSYAFMANMLSLLKKLSSKFYVIGDLKVSLTYLFCQFINTHVTVGNDWWSKVSPETVKNTCLSFYTGQISIEV